MSDLLTKQQIFYLTSNDILILNELNNKFDFELNNYDDTNYETFLLNDISQLIKIINHLNDKKYIDLNTKISETDSFSIIKQKLEHQNLIDIERHFN